MSNLLEDSLTSNEELVRLAQEEAEEVNQRIKNSNISEEVINIGRWINIYTWAARVVVITGALFMIISAIHFFLKGYTASEFGDFTAGTVGLIWSLAGLLFIYVAFLGQKQQLLNQQLELMYSSYSVKQTKVELVRQIDEMSKQNITIKLQQEEMEEQNKTMRLQRFEHSFFQLLGLFDNLVQSIEINGNKGRNAILYSYNEYCGNIYDVIRGTNPKISLKDCSDDNIKKDCMKKAIRYKGLKGEFLNSYLRVLNQILSFIDNSNIENPLVYAEVLKPMLSLQEQILIYSFYLGEEENSKFRFLIDKYKICEKVYNLSMDRVLVQDGITLDDVF